MNEKVCAVEKCLVDSISLPHSHKEFKVSWNQCLNLCSWRWLRPRRNLFQSLIPRGLWISKILLTQGLMEFRSFFLKKLRLAELLMVRSSLFHCYSKRKKWVFKIIMSYIYWRDVIAKSGIMNPVQIRY